MAFQAMNHGLEARAGSRSGIRATQSLEAHRVLMALQPAIREQTCKTPQRGHRW